MFDSPQPGLAPTVRAEYHELVGELLSTMRLAAREDRLHVVYFNSVFEYMLVGRGRACLGSSLYATGIPCGVNCLAVLLIILGLNGRCWAAVCSAECKH